MQLSIIIPTFNRVGLLSQAVDSILAQQPAIYEIVIADDGSTDSTQHWCRNFQQASDRTRVVIVRSAQNVGAQVARNRGVQAATGNAVMFLDSDDVLSKCGLAPLLQRLDVNPTLDYVYGKVIQTDANLSPTEEKLIVGTPFSIASKDIAGYHWHTMGAIYRMPYLQAVGPWNEQLTGSQDWEFQSRVKIAGGQNEFVDHIVGYWREHSETRVGAKKFRYDYVESVIKACLSIQQQANSMGKLNAALERRLVKKILLHVLEFSINGFPQKRQQYLYHTLGAIRFNPSLKLVIRSLLLAPPLVDSVLWALLPRAASSNLASNTTES